MCVGINMQMSHEMQVSDIAILRIENGPSEKGVIDHGVHSTYLDSRISDKSSVQWYYNITHGYCNNYGITCI